MYMQTPVSQPQGWAASTERKEPHRAGDAGSLGRMGLAARAYVNPTAPWSLTDAGLAKARELGVQPPPPLASGGDAQ